MKFKDKVFLVLNVKTMPAGGKHKKSLLNGYLRDPDFMRIYRSPNGRFTVSEELLYFKDRLCVPKLPLSNELLHDFHIIANSGHFGERNIRHKLSQLYYWKTVRQDVTDYVKSCPIC